MRSGSAAIAKNGKIDVMPMTWKKACASESEKTADQLRSAVGSREKENATNQIGNAMKKRGQGGSELRFH